MTSTRYCFGHGVSSFIHSSSGGYQVRDIDVELIKLACSLVGTPFGAVRQIVKQDLVILKSLCMGVKCTSNNSQTGQLSSSVNRVCSHTAVVGREGMKTRKSCIQSVRDRYSIMSIH